MQLPVPILAKAMRTMFDHMRNHVLKEGITKPEGHDFMISFSQGKEAENINGHALFAHGRWMAEPYSAILTVESLPAQLSSGAGRVDLIVRIMPIQDPRLSETQIRINAIYDSQIPDEEAFTADFLKTFVENWNKQA